MAQNDEPTRNTELLSIEKVQEIMKRHAEHLDLMHSRFGPKGDSLMRYDAADQALTALKPLGLDLARLCLSLATQLQQEREAREAAERELAQVREYPGARYVFIDWEMISRGAPVQIEGRDLYTGKELYFRERHGYWRVDLDDKTIASGEGPEAVAGMDEIESWLRPAGIAFGPERAEAGDQT